MADFFDYLQWRGDIPFSQVPPGPVDALLFSSLVYIRFESLVPDTFSGFVSIDEAARRLSDQPNPHSRCRVKTDLSLLHAAAESRRFGSVKLCGYRSTFLPEEDTQFAAMSFLLEDGSLCAAFRGTDKTLVGWKEDFNMTFSDSVPSQRLAAGYIRELTTAISAPIRLTGHSKGGNLAVYAAAAATPEIQDRILGIYNQDGPGFLEHITASAGYRRILPKIHTYVPQSSVIGMLLNHPEDYTIVRSKQVGLMQHDPYTWEILGGGFITLNRLTPDSLFWEQTFREWLKGMTPEERNRFFDALFQLLQTENATRPLDIMKPGNLKTYIRTLSTNEETRRILYRVLFQLLHSAWDTQAEMLSEELEEKKP